MKIIDRHNFISVVCISFTLIVCGKLLFEKTRYYSPAPLCPARFFIFTAS